jgi:hypothetical protein
MIWEYIGLPRATLAPLTPAWQQLTWQRPATAATECLQLLAAGKGQLYFDSASVAQV